MNSTTYSAHAGTGSLRLGHRAIETLRTLAHGVRTHATLYVLAIGTYLIGLLQSLWLGVPLSFGLVSIVGAGGIGKTSVALAVAASLRARFPDGTWWIELAALTDGSLLLHTGVTLAEVLLGLLAGTLAAVMLGYAVAKSRLFERIVSPYLVASQAIPIVAIAPLLVIWFGPGMFSKVLICSLIVFFPVLVNTVVGVRAVPRLLHDLMGSLRATRWQTLRLLELPAALPILLGGLRIGATLSVIGAVVGELVGSDKGLGFLVNLARGQYARLARELGVEMPISEQIYQVLYRAKAPKSAVRDLMSRALKAE